MEVINRDPGESKSIPVNTETNSAHNGSDMDSNTSQNPVGNMKDCD